MKINLACIFLIALIAGCAPKPLIGQDTSTIIDPDTDITESSAYLEIPDQRIENDIVYVPKAYFDRPGFIAVYSTEEILLGVSDIYLSGEYSDTGVEIKDYQSEKSLVATLHYDDGDTRFDEEKDKGALKAGKQVSAAFELQLE